MATLRQTDAELPAEAEPATPSAAAVTAVIAGIAAAWIAAGSAGMIAAPLQHALTWAALAVVLIAAWPRRQGDSPIFAAKQAARNATPTEPRKWGQSPLARLLLVVAVAGAAVMTALGGLAPALDVLAVAVVLAALARLQPRAADGRAILLAALAVIVLAVFRLACDATAVVWLAADALGHGLGLLAGWIAGRPLAIGGNFAGIDYLVLMTALAAAWLVSTKAPRGRRALTAAAAILLGQFAYLVLLAWTPELLGHLPEVAKPQVTDMSRLGTWTWGNAARSLLPWNLPAVALLIQAGIAGAMFRWAAWLPPAKAPPVATESAGRGKGDSPHLCEAPGGPFRQMGTVPFFLGARRRPAGCGHSPVGCAGRGRADSPGPNHRGLRRRRVPPVARIGCQPGRPVPPLARSRPGRPGEGRPSVAARLAVSLFPRTGGSALEIRPLGRLPAGDGDAGGKRGLSPFVQSTRRAGTGRRLVSANGDCPLFPGATSLSPRGAAAVAATRNWEDVCQPTPSLATAGVDAARSGFGLDRPGTLRVGWRAQPLLVGRWAFSTSRSPPGDAAEYAPGDALGDLVLAAGQRVGRGRVVVLGDGSCLGDGRLPASYRFAVGLLGALAARRGSPQDDWRQTLGLLLAAGLVGLLAWRPDALRIAVAAGVLAVSLACSAGSNSAAAVLPDGGLRTPNNLAYIDASHLEAYSGDPRHENGLGRLWQALAESGYLPLLLPTLDAEHLDRAGVLISIAPGREFSPAERKVVGDFVGKGGLLLSMVGAEDAGPSRELLADFGLGVPPMPLPPAENTRETVPLGAPAQVFARDGDRHDAIVQFHAAWPVEGAADAQPLCTASDGQHDYPIILSRKIGSGVVVLIGDSCFAMNKNFEPQAAEHPENAAFWRWLLLRMIRGRTGSRPSRPRSRNRSKHRSNTIFSSGRGDRRCEPGLP